MKAVFGFAARRSAPLLRAAVYIPILMVFGGEVFKSLASEMQPFTGFRVVSVSVPNHCAGENPVVHVSRMLTQGAEGSYLARFDPLSGGASAQAYQSTWFTYKPRRDFFFSTNLYTYFNGGAPFRLRPGTYVGEIQWRFRRPWRNDTTITVRTFPFSVWPDTDPRCIAAAPSGGFFMRIRP